MKTEIRDQRSVVRIAVVTALLVCAALGATAQGFVPAAAPPWVYADNYGRWALQGQAQNTYTFTPANLCNITQLNFTSRGIFAAFGSNVALAPVFIQDKNPANSEVVTPGSAFTPTDTTCGANLSPVNNHTTFSLQSGSGGLQEAINALGGSTAPYAYTIVLSPEWYKLVSNIGSQNATLANSTTPADVITNATCAANIRVVDVTTNPWTYYGCNASSKLAVSTPQPKVSVAASTGAGTSPTIAIEAGSSQGTGTITLTTGTSPSASATVFTVTFSAPDYGGGYIYAASCTVTSVGTSAYSSGTVTSTAGTGTTPGTLVYTASSTALAASTSGFKWYYSCK